jgi:hypothetical protein
LHNSARRLLSACGTDMRQRGKAQVEHVDRRTRLSSHIVAAHQRSPLSWETRRPRWSFHGA